MTTLANYLRSVSELRRVHDGALNIGRSIMERLLPPSTRERFLASQCRASAAAFAWTSVRAVPLFVPTAGKD